MASGAALRAKAISAFRSGIRYSLSAAMFGYWVLDCACICELAPSAITSTELANPIFLNVIRPIRFPPSAQILEAARLFMMRPLLANGIHSKPQASGDAIDECGLTL